MGYDFPEPPGVSKECETGIDMAHRRNMKRAILKNLSYEWNVGSPSEILTG